MRPILFFADHKINQQNETISDLSSELALITGITLLQITGTYVMLSLNTFLLMLLRYIYITKCTFLFRFPFRLSLQPSELPLEELC